MKTQKTSKMFLHVNYLLISKTGIDVFMSILAYRLSTALITLRGIERLLPRFDWECIDTLRSDYVQMYQTVLQSYSRAHLGGGYL